MEENININQNIQSNKYLNFIKKNKYIIFAFSMLIILISVFISLMVVSSNSSSKIAVTPTPTRDGTITPQPTVTFPLVQPTKDTKSQEQKIIENQTKQQLDQRIQISYTIEKVKIYEGNWAIMVVNNPTTDPARVVIKKEKGSWNVILGPGTYFDDADLQAIGAPLNLINEINGIL